MRHRWAAAALGRKRNEPINDLAALNFGVRVDRPGVLLRDFHMAISREKKPVSYLTNRYYLSDAVFLAGLESDDIDFLEKLKNALKNPVFSLFLGRRSCPPTLPIVRGIRSESLLDALRNEPLLTERTEKMRVRYDSPSARAMKHDLPISFDVNHREYGYRHEAETWVSVASSKEEHDPMAELGGDSDVFVKVMLNLNKRETMKALVSPAIFHSAVDLVVIL